MILFDLFTSKWKDVESVVKHKIESGVAMFVKVPLKFWKTDFVHDYWDNFESKVVKR